MNMWISSSREKRWPKLGPISESLEEEHAQGKPNTVDDSRLQRIENATGTLPNKISDVAKKIQYLQTISVIGAIIAALSLLFRK
jgi:hypothetical protein